MKKVLLLGGILLMSLCLLAANGAPATAQTKTSKEAEPGATTVVKNYLRIFNAGMKSGDFSELDHVYASDATLTQSSPKGTTTVVHGLANIKTFYQGLRKKFPGFQWTVESMRSLAENVVLVYQHAGSPPLKVAGRCIHVFVIEDGKITSYDWATYYPGVV
jgi:ketosteroid isomerase-like protein